MVGEYEVTVTSEHAQAEITKKHEAEENANQALPPESYSRSERKDFPWIFVMMAGMRVMMTYITISARD